jgi:ATP-dependent DNA helicase RecG
MSDTTSASDTGTSQPADLNTPVQFVPHVGPLKAPLLQQLGIHTALDLLFHIPHSINDFSDVREVPRLTEDDEQSVHGLVVDRDTRSLKGGRSLTGILLDCNGHYVRGLWFNQPWMRKKFADNDHLVFSGKPRRRGGRWEFNNPVVHLLSPEDQIESAAGVLPRYRLTDGLRMDDLRRITRQAVLDYAPAIPDPLPREFRNRHRLPDLPTAFTWLHAPESAQQFREGRRRVLFDDLLEFQLGMALRRRVWTKTLSAIPVPVSARVDARIRRLFEFRFTDGQNNAVAEITADIGRNQPMHRLLQADVGAGKTAIAAYAMLAGVAAGFQTALMAPTEVLAVQHWETFDELLRDSRVNRALLIGGQKQSHRREVVEGIASGDTQLIIGTQAIIQDAIRFRHLAVAVIDEQHRFGVRQRAAFDSGELSPHILVMTATPIPRSLCLTQFGDLDISVIRDMPPGRQQVVTARISSESEVTRMWQFICKQVAEGRQAYVVCPRIEGQDDDDVSAAETAFQHLRGTVLAGVRVALLHGRMDRTERHDVMDRFRDREIDVLVSTTVIEVGIDVPNASLMVIQQAERFGLSQLHQLRGRVGRGSYKGFCFLLSDADAPDASQRLQAMVESSNGFELAEKDAELRGPGDLLGVRQSGALPLRVAQPQRDLRILEAARKIADQLVESGEFDQPEFRPLKAIVLERFAHVLELPQTG